MKCPRCRNNRFARRRYILKNGEWVQFIRCVICLWTWEVWGGKLSNGRKPKGAYE